MTEQTGGPPPIPKEQKMPEELIPLGLTRAELEAIDEALAITEDEDKLPAHESAFRVVRKALEDSHDPREGEIAVYEVHRRRLGPTLPPSPVCAVADCPSRATDRAGEIHQSPVYECENGHLTRVVEVEA